MKELTGEVIVVKVIYRDNLAAIGLANGTTAASLENKTPENQSRSSP